MSPRCRNSSVAQVPGLDRDSSAQPCRAHLARCVGRERAAPDTPEDLSYRPRCSHCGGPIPKGKPAGTKYCRGAHRMATHRAGKAETERNTAPATAYGNALSACTAALLPGCPRYAKDADVAAAMTLQPGSPAIARDTRFPRTQRERGQRTARLGHVSPLSRVFLQVMALPRSRPMREPTTDAHAEQGMHDAVRRPDYPQPPPPESVAMVIEPRSDVAPSRPPAKPPGPEEPEGPERPISTRPRRPGG